MLVNSVSGENKTARMPFWAALKASGAVRYATAYIFAEIRERPSSICRTSRRRRVIAPVASNPKTGASTSMSPARRLRELRAVKIEAERVFGQSLVFFSQRNFASGRMNRESATRGTRSIRDRERVAQVASAVRLSRSFGTTPFCRMRLSAESVRWARSASAGRFD